VTLLPRHRLVWLDPAALDALSLSDHADRDAVRDWLAAGHPAVVRRSEVDTGHDVPLGIPLPTRLGRRRVALRARPNAILRTGAMPLLSETADAAPLGWRPFVHRVATALGACGAAVHVFGSLGWQALTGEAYLRLSSDIDILIQPAPGFDAGTVLGMLHELAGMTEPRLDGELVLDSDRAVSWRELLTDAEKLLVRSSAGVSLEDRESFLGRLLKEAA
jgi:phosphoribosyl-dephospho-CoA transferase